MDRGLAVSLSVWLAPREARGAILEGDPAGRRRKRRKRWGGGSPGAASVTSLVSRPHTHSHDPTVALIISTAHLYIRQQPPDGTGSILRGAEVPGTPLPGTRVCSGPPASVGTRAAKQGGAQSSGEGSSLGAVQGMLTNNDTEPSQETTLHPKHTPRHSRVLWCLLGRLRQSRRIPQGSRGCLEGGW